RDRGKKPEARSQPMPGPLPPRHDLLLIRRGVSQLHCGRRVLRRSSRCVPLLALAPAGVAQEEDGTVNGENARDERPGKDLTDIAPAPGKDGERQERAGGAAKRVSAAVKAERLAPVGGDDGIGDNGVARSAADGLASAVKQDQAKCDRPRRDKCQERL